MRVPTLGLLHQIHIHLRPVWGTFVTQIFTGVVGSLLWTGWERSAAEPAGEEDGDDQAIFHAIGFHGFHDQMNSSNGMDSISTSINTQLSSMDPEVRNPSFH